MSTDALIKVDHLTLEQVQSVPDTVLAHLLTETRADDDDPVAEFNNRI